MVGQRKKRQITRGALLHIYFEGTNPPPPPTPLRLPGRSVVYFNSPIIEIRGMGIRVRVSWNIWNVLASYFNPPNSLLKAEKLGLLSSVTSLTYIWQSFTPRTVFVYAKLIILASLLGCKFPVDPQLDKDPLNRLTRHPYKKSPFSVTWAPKIDYTWNEFQVDIMNLLEKD